jgi:hypothetical protein
VTPVGLMYGVYIPLAIIVILAILLTVLLRYRAKSKDTIP